VNVLTKPRITEAAARFPDAASELALWFKIVSNAKWHNFVELRQTFSDADRVGDYFIFNIRRNRYRLTAKIQFVVARSDGTESTGFVYVRSFLTHKQYDNPANWDKGVIG
jgi:mRNA interferase HigB